MNRKRERPAINGNATIPLPNIDHQTNSRLQECLGRANAIANEKHFWRLEDYFALPEAKEIFEGSAEEQRAVVLMTVEQAALVGERMRDDSTIWFWYIHKEANYPNAGMEISRKLLRRKLPFSDADVAFMLERLGGIGGLATWTTPVLEPLISLLEKRIQANGFSNSYLKGIKLVDAALESIANAPERKLRERLQRLMDTQNSSRTGRKQVKLPVYEGEAWADAVLAEIGSLDAEVQERWSTLLAHCSTATSASPSASWLKKARDFVSVVGAEEFESRVQKWFPLVNKPRTKRLDHHSEYAPDPNELIIEPHMDVLRGLAWCCSFKEDNAMARSLAELARSCYRKIPLLGPRATRVGNAAVTALGMMPGLEGVYQLAYLKVKVKFGTAQKTIEKAFNTAAERAGLPRDEIEELAVPSYGLTEVGVVEEKMGELTARLTVTGTTSTELVWVKEDGKVQKGVPATVKEKFGEELKELKAAAKDIERMLPAQRERIDTMFLQEKSWPVAVWRERYLDHPLVGVLARRLLWEFGDGGSKAEEARREAGTTREMSRFAAGPRPTQPAARTGIWFGGKLVDLDLREIELKGDEVVRLWHPIGKEVEEVTAWRSWLDAQQIQQPFKQAHREVYLLTEAERRTRTYSNRYAAHVLKQHQFNALCALRGWKNKLRLMVDDEYPPATLHLPKWGLRAEFWIEGVGEDYGTDTNESGVYLRVVTDQVRFYREGASQRTAHAGGGGYHPGYRAADAEPLPLEEIPELVFSEVMRDVDMFVGVASVGNDPTWSDGGPDGRYATYWGEVSFGALNGSAKTRKEVLERLVPRLKIGPQCSLEERFLVVKGKRRTYKIHLGSGNILMSPNDQYLCIVPKQGVAEDGKVLLPFEGDRTLSVIISKAFLLAEDEKIKDETILRQIEGK